MVSDFDVNSPTFAPVANSSVSEPAIMNILAFNFKERLRNMLE